VNSLDDVLNDPSWQRLLDAARRKLERTGGELSGSVGLSKPTDAERRVIIGITGRHRSAEVASLKVELAEVDQAIWNAHHVSLLTALARRDGPVRDRAAERADEALARAAALSEAERRCRNHRAEPWFAQWQEQLATDGTVTRLVRRGELQLVALAAEVLNRLPGNNIPLPMLAEWATGNTKALAGTPLATLVLRALALRDGVPAPGSRADQRARWEAAGVIMDDLASQVLVLNLKARENTVVADWLGDAASFGIPYRLTLHQLSIDPLTPAGKDIFVCENPAVLRAAAGELAESCAPLICTEGQPSAAFHKLLTAAKGTVHWRGDFDWTGLRTTAMARERYSAQPWRMSHDDYLAALESGDSEPLKGAAAASPWEPGLAAAMAEHGRAVMEERLIPDLLQDLAS
jgi:uncharacterized protein (TIGR02679 family)